MRESGGAAPGSGGSLRQFSLGGLGGLGLGGGGARRVVKSDQPKRQMRDRQSLGGAQVGAISKGAGSRRMSIATQHAIDAARYM